MKLTLFSNILVQSFLFFVVCSAAMIITEEHWGESISFAVFAVIIFNLNRFHNLRKEKAVKNKYHFLDSESDFTNILIQLISQVVSVDGKEVRMELHYVRKVLSRYFGEVRVNELIKGIEFYVSQEISNYKPICLILRNKFDVQSKIQLMHMLVGICATDGLISKKEEALLKKIALEIRLPFATFKQILLMHHFRYERDHQDQNYRRKRTKHTSKQELNTAYGILGIIEDAQVNQIKKAYRKLAVKHHPDKVVHLGTEMQKLAKEKFQTISDAYELIKKNRGFS